jgi:hypothetical protein
MRIKAVVIFFAGLCVAALIIAMNTYRQFGSSDLLKQDGQQTREAVLTRIPLGTSIFRAKEVMEAEGFRCSMLNNTGFAEDRPGGPQISHAPANLLWCDSGDRSTRALFISKRWQVSFVDEAGSVSNVAVGVGLTGP